MKTTFLLLFLAINYSHSQSILNHFGIEEIKQIEISFAPNMDGINSENKVVKIVQDSTFIQTTIKLLRQLPATGSIYKKFPRTIPTWRILIIDQDDKSHELRIFGIKLRVPDSSAGTYYSGQQKIGDLEKRLYLAIRSQMFGDWYNCD